MWGEKVKFACKVLRKEYAQIPGYPLVKDHWFTVNLSISKKYSRPNFYYPPSISQAPSCYLS